MEFKSIKVAIVPGTATEVTVASGATLAEVLAIYAEQTGNDITTYDVRIGADVAAMTVIPADGTKVYLVQKVKGRA